MIDHYQLLQWLDPWPMGIRGRRKWKLSLVTMTEVKKLKSCWKEAGAPNSTRVSMATAHRRVVKNNWCGQGASVRSLARCPEVERRPVLMVIGDTIYDGNHRACALIHRGYRGLVLVAEGSKRATSKHLWLPK